MAAVMAGSVVGHAVGHRSVRRRRTQPVALSNPTSVTMAVTVAPRSEPRPPGLPRPASDGAGPRQCRTRASRDKHDLVGIGALGADDGPERGRRGTRRRDNGSCQGTRCDRRGERCLVAVGEVLGQVSVLRSSAGSSNRTSQESSSYVSMSAFQPAGFWTNSATITVDGLR